ncbi:MAG: efflux RND transporter periplasmic adaptor subunit [Bryobacterales bacterium]|nr:efflux RND transporter periplasmic adaptor subunit [Bryobacterales bacterium]
MQVAPVSREAIQRVVAADGVLYPIDQAAVTPKIGAPVEKFLVNRGDHVSQGQLLAVLENKDLAGAAAESKSQVDQAEAGYRLTTGASLPEEIVRSQGEVQAARQAVEAARALAGSRRQLLNEGAIARRLVDEAEVALAQAQAHLQTAQEHLKTLNAVAGADQVKQAASQVEAAKGRHQAAEAQLGYSQIRSPIAGIVADRPLYAGEMASAGTPLLTVVDISRIVARANVPLDQAAYVKPGDSASIAPADNLPPVHGKVTVVSPAADTGSTTLQVWVQADNPGNRLKPGAAVRVAIVTGTLPDAVTVPLAALLPSPGGGVMVMSVDGDSVVHRKDVETGVRNAGRVQILKGVSPGEQVVIVGGMGLEDGAKVQIRNSGGKPEQK